MRERREKKGGSKGEKGKRREGGRREGEKGEGGREGEKEGGREGEKGEGEDMIEHCQRVWCSFSRERRG